MSGGRKWFSARPAEGGRRRRGKTGAPDQPAPPADGNGERPQWLAADQPHKAEWTASAHDLDPGLPDWLASSGTAPDAPGSGRTTISRRLIATPGPTERPEWLADYQPAKRDWSPARDRLQAELVRLARKAEEKRQRRRARLGRRAVTNGEAVEAPLDSSLPSEMAETEAPYLRRAADFTTAAVSAAGEMWKRRATERAQVAEARARAQARRATATMATATDAETRSTAPTAPSAPWLPPGVQHREAAAPSATPPAPVQVVPPPPPMPLGPAAFSPSMAPPRPVFTPPPAPAAPAAPTAPVPAEEPPTEAVRPWPARPAPALPEIPPPPPVEAAAPAPAPAPPAQPVLPDLAAAGAAPPSSPAEPAAPPATPAIRPWPVRAPGAEPVPRAKPEVHGPVSEPPVMPAEPALPDLAATVPVAPAPPAFSPPQPAPPGPPEPAQEAAPDLSTSAPPPARVSTELELDALRDRRGSPGFLKAPFALMGSLREEIRLIQTRRERAREAERKGILDSIRNLPDDGYQQMVLDIFRRDGYVILKAENNVIDVIDLECQRQSERVFVQFRNRGDLLVSEDKVREVQAAMVTGGANGGFLFTDGSFTWGADELARQTGIVLVDGNVLVDLMEEMTMADAAQRSGGAKVTGLLKGMFGKSGS